MAEVSNIAHRIAEAMGLACDLEIHAFESGTAKPASLFADAALTQGIPNPVPVKFGSPIPHFYYANPGGLRVKVVNANSQSVVFDDDPYDRPVSLLTLSGGEGSDMVGNRLKAGTGLRVQTVSEWIAEGPLMLSQFAGDDQQRLVAAIREGTAWRGDVQGHTVQLGRGQLTLPAPFETVETVDVEEIRTVDIGSVSGEGQNLVLTGDQNIIDLAYSVRWNIRDPELYLFELKDPDATVQEVAETAMRAVLATISLNEALGAGRTGIEQQVAQKMQEILDGYRSGIRIQGIAIKQADPPNEVNDAFKEVSAAKQDATTYVNQATAYAQQLSARAQGEAAAFDKVYVQYKLSPEVTRRRMYYETMEAILAETDKTIVEANNVTPYLPLPEIKRKTKDNAAAAAAEGGR